MVPIGYISPLVAPRADSSFFRKRPYFSSCWGAKRDRGGFLPPHHPSKLLGPDGAVSAPKGSLRSGSSFFVQLLQPFCLYQEVLGVVAANMKFLAFVSKIHHPEEVYLLFPMHPYSGYFLQFMTFGKVFQFLAICLGLSTAPQVFKRVMAPVRSFSPQSWIRLWPFLHDCLIQASS